MPLLPILHRQQRRPAECLAACVAMVLDYLQQLHSYDMLLKILQVGYAGAPFHNLHYLEKLGVSVSIEQGQITTLRAALTKKLPPIVFVATQELAYWHEATNHAVVIAGLDDDKIYINDPAFPDAPKVVTIDEFALAWLEMDEFLAILQ